MRCGNYVLFEVLVEYIAQGETAEGLTREMLSEGVRDTAWRVQMQCGDWC